jgi:NAD(P)-dependent dehydrogenase (short-subunit alcohol dehydrogenase family)
MGKLDGKVALVTGAAAGIGKAVAVRFASEGAAVVVADIDEGGGRETVAALEAAGVAAAFARGDVADRTDVQAMVAVPEARFGGLDVLVNNAGGAPEPHYPEAPTDHWMRMLDVNLRAVMLATQLALEPMRRRGGGAVVNVASVAALGYEAYVAPEYAAAKAAVVRLTSWLASLAERDNVRVTCICPDWVATDAVLESFAQATAAERKDIPPLVPVEETAEEILQLATDESLSGRVLVHWAGGPKYVVPTDLQSRSWRGTEESS